MGPNVSALSRNQIFADEQTQAEAVMICRSRIGCLKYAFKNPLGHVRIDPASRVCDLQQQKIRILFECTSLNRHLAVLRSELDGVINQNDEDLSKACWVSAN